jgi:hypothetical protein
MGCFSYSPSVVNKLIANSMDTLGISAIDPVVTELVGAYIGDLESD